MKRGFLKKESSKENRTIQSTVRGNHSREDVPTPSRSSEEKPSWAKKGFLERGRSSRRKSRQLQDEKGDLNKTSKCDTSAKIKEYATMEEDETSTKVSSRPTSRMTKGGEKSTLWKKGFLTDSCPKEKPQCRGASHGPTATSTTLNIDKKLKKGDSSLLLLEHKEENIKETRVDRSLLFLDHEHEENDSQEGASASRTLITDVTSDTSSKTSSVHSKPFNGGFKPNLFHIVTSVDDPEKAESPIRNYSDQNPKKTEHGNQDSEEILFKPISSRKKVIDNDGIREEETDKKGTKEVTFEMVSSEVIDVKVYVPTLQTDLSMVLAKLRKEVKRVRTSIRRERAQQSQEGNKEYPLKRNKKTEYPLFLTAFLEENVQSGNGSLCNESDGFNQYEKQLSLSKLKFIWNCILESIASHAKDKIGISVDCVLDYPHTIVLGMCLLKMYPREGLVSLLDPFQVSARFVEDADRKRSKTQILGAAFLLKMQILQWMETLRNDFGSDDVVTMASINQLSYLLDQGLSLMTAWVLENDGVENIGKRTLLKQICMDSSFLILEYASLYWQAFGSQPLLSKSTISRTLWNTISTFRMLLGVKKDWILPENENENENVESISYRNVVTKDCENRVINDWLKILSLLERHHNHLKNTEGINILLAPSCLYANELAGVSLEGHQESDHTLCRMRFGGVAQTLCKDNPERCRQPKDMQSALRAALYFMENRESTSDEETIDDKNDFFEGRFSEEIPILRGIASWLSTKKFLKMLSEFVLSSEINQAALSNNLMLLLRSRSERCIEFIEVIL